ncbi:MAG: redox-sensing transcriptional repressor Rex [Gammaproteobacteria bacterium]|nr:redox-sensing transcriptional repressor Rex [Gammaproteobacteria bacterium]
MSNLPQPTIHRLPRYLFWLEQLRSRMETISSSELARLADETAATVRRDLSCLGSHGIRGVGYDIERLATEIRNQLGLSRSWDVVIVGAGHLGTALAHYEGFEGEGLRVIGIYDSAPAKIGTRVEALTVKHPDQMAEDLAESDRAFGIITVPPDAAQDAADLLIDAGVTGILSFAPTLLTIPRHVFVRHVDLATELHVLGYYAAARRHSA